MTKKNDQLENVETPVTPEESPVVKAEETPEVVVESAVEEIVKADETPEVTPEAEEVAKADAVDNDVVIKSLENYEEVIKSYGETVETLTKSVDAVAKSLEAITETLKKVDGLESAVAEVLQTMTEIAQAEVDKSFALTNPPMRTVEEYLDTQKPSERLQKAVELSIAARQQMNG